MKIFRTYTRASLRSNRSRTLVTIIGIVLSMALFTAVIEGAFSGLQFMIRAEEARSGSFHAVVSELTQAEAETLCRDPELRRSAVWRLVGWAKVNDSEMQPYLLIQDISAQTVDLANIRITQGRLPEAETELVLPLHFLRYDGTDYRLGDTLTLSVGARRQNGEPAGLTDAYQPDEELVNVTERTYTIVGFCERLSEKIEPFECPGFLALTWGGGEGSQTVLFTVKHPGSIYTWLLDPPTAGNYQTNNSLLNFYGSLRNQNLTRVLYGLATILTVLIACGSIALIYNSFSISVSERTRQFGILKSVGASNRQIRGCVFLEALYLDLIAIPLGLAVGCAGIGLTLYFLRGAFTAFAPQGSGVQMQLVISPVGLLLAVAVCILTTLLSAFIPALRTLRITPMQAIRQSEDVKLTRHDVRSHRLTERLFGFEGMMAAKNFRRNRKRYRSTVISLALSVTLFIAASSFCTYLSDAVNDAVSNRVAGFDIVYTAGGSVDDDLLYADLSSVPGVSAAGRTQELGTQLCFPADAVTEEYRSSPLYNTDAPQDRVLGGSLEGDWDALQYTQVCFLDEDVFRRLCTDNGYREEAFFNEDAPMGLLWNHIAQQYYDADTGARWLITPLLRNGTTPLEVYTRFPLPIDGYDSILKTVGDDGQLVYLYAPHDLLEDTPWEDLMQSDRLLSIPEVECTQTVRFTVAGFVDRLPFFAEGSNTPVLFYPASMRQSVLLEQGFDDVERTVFYFRAEDHASVAAQMEELLAQPGAPADGTLSDLSAGNESERMLITVINVFSYGFILLISLIAAANVFNTISTSIALRRRELAMLRSIGLGRRSFFRMMNYECLIYGFRALLYGLPVAVLLTVLIYRSIAAGFDRSFYLPWGSIAIAVGSVFLVVFCSMFYASGKIKKHNIVETLRQEML